MRMPLADDEVFGLRPDATRTERELLTLCTAEKARESLLCQVNGLPKARGSAPPILPASTNNMGCWLASGAGKRSGHVGMAPFFPRKKGRAANGKGVKRLKNCGQLLHRLAVRAFGSRADVRNMLQYRLDVSHLCHVARCFNPAHLVLKSHMCNMSRRDCADGGVCVCALEPSCLL
jgi:hypothetical protein